MSHDLVASAEELLSSIDDPSLKDILTDYILEKRFSSMIQDLDENLRLREICQDRDNWEQLHLAAFTEHWKPEMPLSSFGKVKISYIPQDNSQAMTFNLSREDYHCGNTYTDERSIELFKSWLFIPEGQKPWLEFWNSELINETKARFDSLVVKLCPEQPLAWFYSIVGVSSTFFESSQELIMKKIARFQNLIYFLSKAKAEKLDNLYPLLVNFRIIIDPNDQEDGSTSLISHLTSLGQFDPLSINKVFKDIVKARSVEIKRAETEKKAKELARLTEKFSQTDLNELEQLIKLKKELNK